MSSEISTGMRQEVAARAYHVCEYCLMHEDDSMLNWEVDHIISLKHRGPTTMANLAYACLRCNRHKGSDLSSIVPRTGVMVRFFHPRKDRWKDHFCFDGVRIEPLTEIGEATALALRFNEPDRVLRRKLLAEIGRYPTIEALALMSG